MNGTWQLKIIFIAWGSVHRVRASVGQDSIRTHDRGSGGDIPGNDRVGADCGPTADVHSSQNLCARADIDACLNLRGAGGQIAPAKSNLMANDDIVSEAGAGVETMSSLAIRLLLAGGPGQYRIPGST